MKFSLLSFLILSSQTLFSQYQIATTEDGKKVLLKDNKTWEYIEMESTKPKENLSTKDTSKVIFDTLKCNIVAGFKEPRTSRSSTMDVIGLTSHDIKILIAIDRNVEVKDITIIEAFEKLQYSLYTVCIDGYKYKYKRTGKKIKRESFREN